MKKYIFLIFGFITTFSFAQTFIIQYTETTDLKALEDSINSNERMKAFISEDMKKQFFSQISKPQNFSLTYSNGKSLYSIIPNTEESEDENLQVGQGRSFNIRTMRNQNSPIIYKNFDTHTLTKQQPIFDKKFLIKDQIQSLEWEVTDQKKTFGDFTCTIATTYNARKEKVSVCYSEDIPINDGPDDYYGLPGLVVEVIIGPKHINLTEMKILDESTDLKEPTEGKIVTQKEYNDLMKERIEQMRQNGGRGMGVFH